METMLNNLALYGYIFLFIYSFGGGMVAIIAAGILSFNGKLDLTLSIFVAALGNFIGSSLLFYLAKYNKEQISPFIKKHGRKFALAQLAIKKYGKAIIFVQKYIYGVKTLVPLAIGLTKYKVSKFLILNLLASIIWGVSLGLLSFYLGDFFVRLYNYSGQKSYIFPLILLAIFAGIFYYFARLTKKKTKEN